ncbi:hypothetical protein DJ021_03050 [Phenylobacterium hankyongense]|uniref:Uncharacterized protein n=1 Tax=Phenylobacterium hankyongense TaxID=1813876 RepID=A0A328B1H3_9CAUL|nr:hypothetical protein [Phenylobacterium hankyongense]RAK58848.1 hypothetical protein DJ021_03050 [Phenylobacterium hankyongense]
MSRYHLRITLEKDLGHGRLELECENDREAVQIAFGADSPRGHALWQERRFLGVFAPGPRGEPS